MNGKLKQEAKNKTINICHFFRDVHKIIYAFACLLTEVVPFKTLIAVARFYLKLLSLIHDRSVYCLNCGLYFSLISLHGPYLGSILLSYKHVVYLYAMNISQVRTFKGHTNEKNFVGLTVNNEYIACGSETNEVFVYHKVSYFLYSNLV